MQVSRPLGVMLNEDVLDAAALLSPSWYLFEGEVQQRPRDDCKAKQEREETPQAETQLPQETFGKRSDVLREVAELLRFKPE